MTFHDIVWKNVVRDKWTYIAYFLSSVFSIFIFFSFAVSMFHPDLAVISNGSMLAISMTVGAILVYLFSFIFITFSIMAFMHNKKKTLGLFMLIGASKQQMHRMLFYENIIIGVSAIVTAIVAGVICSPLFLLLSRKVLQIDGFAFYMPFKAIGITVLLFLTLFMIVAFISPRMLRTTQIIQLVKGDKQGEKAAVFSRVKWLIGMGMLACIPATIVWLPQQIEANTLMQLCLFLLFLGGLYVVFYQSIQGVLQRIRQSSSFMQGTRPLVVSNLMSAVRANTKMMYLVTILLLGAFFAIIILYLFSTNVAKDTRSNYPFVYTYASHVDNTHEQQHLTIIDDKLNQQPGFAKQELAILVEEDERVGYISNSQYNEAATLLHMSPINLQASEVAIVAGNVGVIPQKDIETQPLDKALLAVKNVIEKNITPTGYFSRLIVLQDEDYTKINKATLSAMTFTNYTFENWTQFIEQDRALNQVLQGNIYERASLFSAVGLYNTERISKNLALYIGFMLALIFIAASLSMIYFRLITHVDRERQQFKSLCKMGLSLQQFHRIINHQLAFLMLVPFVIAVMLVLLALLLAQQLFTSSAVIIVGSITLFALLQLTGYLYVRKYYKKSLLTM